MCYNVIYESQKHVKNLKEKIYIYIEPSVVIKLAHG